jgi:hypothetical protein
MKESQIVFDSGPVWVWKGPESYTVFRASPVYSNPDSSYEPTPDGLSIAIARAEYLTKKAKK